MIILNSKNIIKGNKIIILKIFKNIRLKLKIINKILMIKSLLYRIFKNN